MRKNIPIEIQDIFKYVKSKKFSQWNTTLSKLRYLAEIEFLPLLKSVTQDNYGQYVKIIKDYDFTPDTKSKTLLWALECFRDELLIVVEKTFDKDWEKKLEKYRLVRQVSPPLSAYKYEAFCKQDIKSTGRDYGLLFE